jgi:hypothetical protein
MDKEINNFDIEKMERKTRLHFLSNRASVIRKYYPNGIKWLCHDCTFENNNLIFECEICEAEKKYEDY